MSDTDFYAYVTSLFSRLREYMTINEEEEHLISEKELQKSGISSKIEILEMAEYSYGVDFFIRTQDIQFQINVHNEKDEAHCYALELDGYVVYVNSLEHPVALMEGFNLMFYHYTQSILKTT